MNDTFFLSAPQLKRDPLDGARKVDVHPKTREERFFPLVVLALVWGCGAGWHRPRSALPATLAPRQQVQVWQDGAALQWHAVRLTAESVSGIPFLQPVECDSCRIAVARVTVDSSRLGNPVASFWKTMGLVTAIVFTPVIIYCWKGCSSN